MAISRRTVVIAGLPVHVYSEGGLEAISGPVSVLFLLHGRMGSAHQIDSVAEEAMKVVSEKRQSKEASIGLIVVTFDQRNHGERLVDTFANGAWKENGNDRHAIDMYATYVGTAKDVSYLIDFLPSYIFPSGEAEVVQWSVGGISLGGHASWIVLRQEPRITLGIPIIGCPDYLKLISGRAKESEIPFEPPYIPKTFLSYIQQHDPAQASYTISEASNPFLGKKILVLSGADDPLVQWSCSQEFVENLQCTPDMVKEMANFVWDNVLVVA
ncbi:hypothetical protein EW026_g333 [Hermanssonia centrifuga]|uniref:Uncharacterized protein n=1 Tax=Hermanssonia centrifuga TaxID=98765 RepID=A0A4S4KV76_9APHY|nr:hypothetical protein EW026_g333 [Hermanssonia centrifuga]